MDKKKFLYITGGVIGALILLSFVKKGYGEKLAYQERYCEINERLAAGDFDDEEHKANMEAEREGIKKKYNVTEQC